MFRNINIVLIILFCFIACKEKYELTEDTRNIVNLLIPKEEQVCLFEKSYYKIPKGPTYLINHYLRIYRQNDSIKKETAIYDIFYKHVDGILSIEELREMKTRYIKWSKIKWEKEQFQNEQIAIISKLEECKNPYIILEPLYSKDKKKAIVGISHSGGKILKVFQKIDGKWKNIGGIPIGTSD